MLCSLLGFPLIVNYRPQAKFSGERRASPRGGRAIYGIRGIKLTEMSLSKLWTKLRLSFYALSAHVGGTK